MLKKYKIFEHFPNEFLNKILNGAGFSDDEFLIFKLSIIGQGNEEKRQPFMVEYICDKLAISKSTYHYLKNITLAKAYTLLIGGLRRLDF